MTEDLSERETVKGETIRNADELFDRIKVKTASLNEGLAEQLDEANSYLEELVEIANQNLKEDQHISMEDPQLWEKVYSFFSAYGDRDIYKDMIRESSEYHIRRRYENDKAAICAQIVTQAAIDNCDFKDFSWERYLQEFGLDEDMQIKEFMNIMYSERQNEAAYSKLHPEEPNTPQNSAKVLDFVRHHTNWEKAAYWLNPSRQEELKKYKTTQIAENTGFNF